MPLPIGVAPPKYAEVALLLTFMTVLRSADEAVLPPPPPSPKFPLLTRPSRATLETVGKNVLAVSSMIVVIVLSLPSALVLVLVDEDDFS